MSHTMVMSRELGLGRYRPYPAYKESDVEWLGEIPAHWQVKKTASIFTIGSGTTPNSDNISFYDGNIPWITTSELRERTIEKTKKSISPFALEKHPSLRIHPKGSLAIAMYGATIGRLGILGVDSTVNQACCVFSNPRGIDVKFTFYWFQMRRNYLISLGYGGGQPNLSQNLLRSVRIPVPPLAEQSSINSFLDRKAAEIDELIAKKERLIKLLQEKRSTLITQAVTKGLDPTVPMKDSGVEWLGEIPAHWDIERSKRVFSVRKEKAVPSDKQLTCSQKYGVILQEQFMLLEGQKIVQVISGADILKHVEPNDFVISMRSFQGGIERSYVGGSISSAYVVLIPSKNVEHRYFSYLLKSKQYIQALQSTTNLVRDGQALRFANFSLVDLPLLPLSEQQSISQFLDRKMAEIDALIAKVKEGVKRLKEYRTALISAAVTGKIDVREEVA